MANKKPTTAELDILTILWDDGPSSVRDVHRQLTEARDVLYTTTLKTMQVMLKKGLLLRDDSERAHIYRAAIEQSDVEKTLLGGIASSLFSGSTAQLVISALGHDKPSPDELDEIRKLIDQLEKSGDE